MKFRLTSHFGVMEEVRGMKPHTGIDLAMPQGTTLRSAFDGVVEKVYNNTNSLGYGVKIDHGNGTNTIYGHMKEVDVKVGEHVSQGDLIGFSGNTGNSTGPHLHFGMQKDDGTFLDPTKYAEHVANLSGDHIETSKGILKGLFGTTPLGDHIVNSVKSRMREEASNRTHEIVMGVLDGLSDILVETIGAISLVGCTILIIMKIAGYDKGYKQAGMLFVLNLLVKMTLGGK